ncbi:MAG: argininosuccinate synthase [Deltaproteobacteria bacterium]|nr:argininosuccinate synthase [Deltaproteobacteria bacterium]
MEKKIKKVVLAYSGGLDTSVIITWLKEKYGCEVVAFAADVGQGEELKPLKKKAIKSGASKIFIEDLREEFVKDYVFPMLRGAAVYEAGYLLGTSIARPLIAKAQMAVAKAVGADAVCHGATGKGNDQVRFEFGYYSINPRIKVVAPWREWEFKGRADLLAYAKKHKIDVSASKKKPYSMDRNLLHISFEGGSIEDVSIEPPKDTYVMTVPLERAPDKPTYVEIGFKEGTPITVDGKRLSGVKLLERLNSLGCKNAIGRLDCVESRYVGMKSRGIYETPGGTILHEARKAIESITMDREVMHLRDSLVPRYADIIYNGYWFSPEREALQAFIDKAASVVTGTARLKLYKGNVIVAGRFSPHSLYDPELASFEEEDVYDQKDAEGFIKINALRLKLNSLKGAGGRKKIGKKKK